MKYGYKTDIGKQKQEEGRINEDSIVTTMIETEVRGQKHEVGIFVLADGGGGADAGDLASRYIVESVCQRTLSELRPLVTHTADRLEKTIDSIDDGSDTVTQELKEDDGSNKSEQEITNNEGNNNTTGDRIFNSLPFFDNSSTKQSTPADDKADQRTEPIPEAAVLDGLLADTIPNTFQDFEHILEKVIQDTHAELAEHAEATNKSLFSTVVAGIVCDSWMSFAWVGDSRIYISNQQAETIEQITEDHSKVTNLLQNGEIDFAQALVHPNGNEITRAVGSNMMEQPLNVDTNTVPLFAEDRVLFTSDGLIDAWEPGIALQQELQFGMTENLAKEVKNKSITEDDIFEILSGSDDLSQIAQECVTVANDRGGKDNISAIVINDENSPETPNQYSVRDPSVDTQVVSKNEPEQTRPDEDTEDIEADEDTKDTKPDEDTEDIEDDGESEDTKSGEDTEDVEVEEDTKDTKSDEATEDIEADEETEEIEDGGERKNTR